MEIENWRDQTEQIQDKCLKETVNNLLFLQKEIKDKTGVDVKFRHKHSLEFDINKIRNIDKRDGITFEFECVILDKTLQTPENVKIINEIIDKEK